MSEPGYAAIQLGYYTDHDAECLQRRFDEINSLPRRERWRAFIHTEDPQGRIREFDARLSQVLSEALAEEAGHESLTFVPELQHADEMLWAFCDRPGCCCRLGWVHYTDKDGAPSHPFRFTCKCGEEHTATLNATFCWFTRPWLFPEEPIGGGQGAAP